jgi:hypothetical protein
LQVLQSLLRIGRVVDLDSPRHRVLNEIDHGPRMGRWLLGQIRVVQQVFDGDTQARQHSVHVCLPSHVVPVVGRAADLD